MLNTALILGLHVVEDQARLVHAGIPEVGPVLGLGSISPAFSLALRYLDRVDHGQQRHDFSVSLHDSHQGSRRARKSGLFLRKSTRFDI